MNLTRSAILALRLAPCGIAVLLTAALGSAAMAAPKFDHSHAVWASVLKKHVSGPETATRVDYKALKAKPAEFDSYLKSLSAVSLKEFEGWSADLRLAFLINAYNAFTIKLVSDHYPVRSIKKIGSLFKSAWKKKFFILLGGERHLDWIEHDMIRPRFAEPRIHFALNCASIGCPPLRKEPYLGEGLSKQLEEAAGRFLKDTSRNRYDEKTGTLRLSRIFDWYERDFEAYATSVKAFAAARMGSSESERKKILTAKDIEYLDYDWNLNETPAPKK